jgi:NAD kinase
MNQSSSHPSTALHGGHHDPSRLVAELSEAREELARLRGMLNSSTTAESKPHQGAPRLPPAFQKIRRRHTDVGGMSDMSRRRHSVDEPRMPRRSTIFDKQLHHSLGLWFLLANQLHFDEGEDEGMRDPGASNHLTTVSFANDGRSSVATAAAAVVSVAMAKSWTSIGAGTNRAGLTSASGGALESSSGSLGRGNDKPAVPRTRFRLVAAIPKDPAKLLEAEERHQRYERAERDGRDEKNGADQMSEKSIPLDSLDPTEDSATEWAAYGAHLKLQWMSKPKRMLVVFKLSHEAREVAVQVIGFLLREGVSVYVEPGQHDAVSELLFGASASCSERDSDAIVGSLLTWTYDSEGGSAHRDDSGKVQAIPEEVGSMLDVIFTVGGDGTVLWVCSLLGTVASVPPIVAISMGSLGFMTPFSVSRLEKLCSSVTSPDRELPLLLRHRLQCRIVRNPAGDSDGMGIGAAAAVDAVTAAPSHLTNGTPAHGTCSGADTIIVLNEVVIDRGMTASLTKLECYIDGNYVTVIQGDGLIVSTPTGSTAYNLAAGGSMVHPAVPCILFTPICPHTLSSRPMVFPEHVVLRLKVPADSREDLSCSFDGKMRTALRPGDSVVVYTCQSPVPMVCHLDASHDFFSSVKEGLDWNRRVVQGQPRTI